jgi:hypothetical protein
MPMANLEKELRIARIVEIELCDGFRPEAVEGLRSSMSCEIGG